MAVAVQRAGLGVVLASLDATGQVELRVRGRRDRVVLLAFLGDVRGTRRRQGDAIVLACGAGPWLGSHGTGCERCDPEADGSYVLAHVAGALTVLAGAVALVGYVEQDGYLGD